MQPTSSQPPDPRALSTMLLPRRDERRPDWSGDELRDMLRHQLAAPLHLSLGTLSGEVAHQLRTSSPPLNPMMTMGQLLHHAKPPLELLKLVKRFAKMCRNDHDNPLPSEIVMLLYYSSVVLAWARLEQRISDLAPATLRRGVKWILAQPWVTPEIVTLLDDALDRVDQAQREERP